jgi:hypothetical protein
MALEPIQPNIVIYMVKNCLQIKKKKKKKKALKVG